MSLLICDFRNAFHILMVKLLVLRDNLMWFCFFMKIYVPIMYWFTNFLKTIIHF